MISVRKVECDLEIGEAFYLGEVISIDIDPDKALALLRILDNRKGYSPVRLDENPFTDEVLENDKFGDGSFAGELADKLRKVVLQNSGGGK